MSSLIARISHALSEALNSSVGPRSSPPPEGLAPISPWAIWLLFSLVRHEQRQQWVAEIVSNVMGGDLAAIAEAGALGQPPIKSSGVVPGCTDWEYLLHGQGCCLTNRLSGEVIDVDFHDGSAEWFDKYFFVHFLESLKQPEFVERRVIALHPTLETVVLAFDELLEVKLLVPHKTSKVVRLAPKCRAWASQVNRLGGRCADSDGSVQVGAALGDWFLVKESGDNRDSVAKRLDDCNKARRDRLIRLFNESRTRRLAFGALVDLGGDDACFALENALQDSPSGTVSAAMDILHAREGEDWSNQVLQLLRRTNPNGEIPEPHIWLSCAHYILRRDAHNQDVRKGLVRIDQRELGEAAILALEFAPEHAISLFRKALRSNVPMDRTTAAAALAILDQPWSRAELINVLAGSEDQIATAECRAALDSLPDVEMHAIVREWERRNPHEPEIGRYVSMGEMALRTRNDWLQRVCETLHNRVLPLRKSPAPQAKL